MKDIPDNIMQMITDYMADRPETITSIEQEQVYIISYGNCKEMVIITENGIELMGYICRE